MTVVDPAREAPLLADQLAARPDPAAFGWRAATATSAAVIGTTLTGVIVFLAVRGAPALRAHGTDLPVATTSLARLAWPLVLGSTWIALLALAIAAPVALGVALFVTRYAPVAVARPLAVLIDLLAGVPSVVYGLWGLLVVAPLTAPVGTWLSHAVGWLPLFAGPASVTGRTVATAATVLAVMIMPIMAALAREVFAQTPAGPVEAALALGATRAESIRIAVLPPAWPALTAAAMLAFARALGETMAVAMVLSSNPLHWTWSIITSSGPSTAAAFIAQSFPEAHGPQVDALLALGGALFAVTFLVNAAARRITGVSTRSGRSRR